MAHGLHDELALSVSHGYDRKLFVRNISHLSPGAPRHQSARPVAQLGSGCPLGVVPSSERDPNAITFPTKLPARSPFPAERLNAREKRIHAVLSALE